jgi:teichuronic acid biosynthesis glycosyltransferase TuaC
MRVLALSTLYPNAVNPRFGTFVARSLEALAKRDDCEVVVINPIGIAPLSLGRYRAMAQAAVDGCENGIEIHRPTFRLIPRISGRFNPAAIARAVLPLARRLHAEQPFDLLDAQFFYPDGPAVARIASALDLPFSIKARGADIHHWGSLPYAARQMRSAADNAAGLLAVCKALARDMVDIGLPKSKIAIHYTGLDRDRFRPLQNPTLRPRLAKELGLPLRHEESLLVTVGALIPRKGQELVIRALRELPEARLLLVGKGEDEERLQALALQMGPDIEQRVHFLGLLDHDLLPLVLSAANAMVLPSASEGLANAWVEALACGTPIVITDAGGAREVVATHAAGRIVEREPLAIAHGIASLLAAPPKREDTMAAAAQFDWTVHAARLAKYYAGLVADAR